MSHEPYDEKGFFSRQWDFVALHLSHELPSLYTILYAPGHSSYMHHYHLALPATALLLPVSLPVRDALDDEAAAKLSTLLHGCSFVFSFIHRWVTGASAITSWDRYVRLSMSAPLAFCAQVRLRV